MSLAVSLFFNICCLSLTNATCVCQAAPPLSQLIRAIVQGCVLYVWGGVYLCGLNLIRVIVEADNAMAPWISFFCSPYRVRGCTMWVVTVSVCLSVCVCVCVGRVSASCQANCLVFFTLFSAEAQPHGVRKDTGKGGENGKEEKGRKQG